VHILIRIRHVGRPQIAEGIWRSVLQQIEIGAGMLLLATWLTGLNQGKSSEFTAKLKLITARQVSALLITHRCTALVGKYNAYAAYTEQMPL